MTYLLTRESAREAGAFYGDKRISELVPPEGLTLADVVKLHIPLEDIVWAITQAMGLPDRILRLSAVDSARRALARIESPHPDSVAACDVAERHALGKATDEELAVAWEAAREAAWAARTAAVAAAWAVAEARTAAVAAAWAAAAARTAREAARTAAVAAAWATAASWTAEAEVAGTNGVNEERRQQIATLVRLVEEDL